MADDREMRAQYMAEVLAARRLMSPTADRSARRNGWARGPLVAAMIERLCTDPESRSTWDALDGAQRALWMFDFAGGPHLQGRESPALKCP